ncbi:MAG: GspMb/PilO family protein [Terriglobales bacterium]|jgi:type IV pilus assembly protein PilO
MPDLRQTRRKTQIALAAMAAVDVLALAVYFSPLVGSQSARQEQLHDLWKELQQKTREVEPLRGLDKKVPLARKQIDQFYKDRLPAEGSSISEDIGKLAGQAGVKISSVRYDMRDPETMGVQRVLIEADMNGDYLQLVRFINSLERDQMFFLVDSVQLGGEQGGMVKLQMKMETYLKTGAA